MISASTLCDYGTYVADRVLVRDLECMAGYSGWSGVQVLP